MNRQTPPTITRDSDLVRPDGSLREPAERIKPRRSWAEKFGEAVCGIKHGIRGHSSFFVHFFFAALTLAAGITIGCEPLEWCILIGCIGLVITAELFNSALETLFHGLDAAAKDRIQHCLDIAAGAVLVASVTAAIIGLVIFAPKIVNYLPAW